MRILVVLSALYFLFLLAFEANAQQSVITVRFANPEYESSTQNYSLDVEFQSSIAGKQLYIMNVRFYYADSVLEFESFGEFATGYEQLGTVQVLTGSASSGPGMFGFPGCSEYVNGAVQKTGTPTAYINPTTWTKLFNVNFHVDDTSAYNIESFCPSAIWDLKENPEEGGMSGSGGVTITVCNGSGSEPTIENVDQFNWQYDGIPGFPFGFPVNSICISTTENDNLLHNIIVPYGQIACYDATQTIFAAGEGTTFIIQYGGDATLIAGQNIFLLPGTLVESGGNLLAAITTTGNYCDSYESSMASNLPPQEEVLPEPDFSGNSFKVYPNPTKGKFTLLLDEPVEGQSCYIQVAGMLGNQIVRQKLEGSDHFEFDLTGQNPGIYFIRFVKGELVETDKLVIN